MKIKVMGPSITSSEIKEVSKMMKYHWDDYSYVEKFEKSFQNFIRQNLV